MIPLAHINEIRNAKERIGDLSEEISNQRNFVLRLAKTIEATTAEVYDAVTDPAHLSHWFTTSARADLRIGGEYSNADGDKGGVP